MVRLDTTWLTLRAGLRDVFLQEHHRPYNVFSAFLDYPNDGCPQMITLIGQETKRTAVQKLRLGSGTQDSASGEVHLRIDQDAMRDGLPTIVADCELHDASSLAIIGAERSLGDLTRRPLTWHRNITQSLDQVTLAHIIYSKLLVPFSNVLCLFSDDLGGLNAVAELLVVWLIGLSNRPSDLPAATYPRVLILTQTNDYAKFEEMNATKLFMTILGKEAEKKCGILMGNGSKRIKRGELEKLLASQFGELRVIALPPLESTSRPWRSLKSRIMKYSIELQDVKRQSHVAFSSEHFRAFFTLACDHFCSDIASPFSFVRASRIKNPVPTGFLSHTAKFLKRVNPVQVLNFAVPVIASALVFESYPPGMHGFHPLSVFKQLFYQICLSLDPFANCDQAVTSSQLANAIEVAFCQYASNVINNGVDGAKLHRTVLTRFKEVWKEMKSNQDCLACSARSPENTLPCHHSLCTPCTLAHGMACEDEPWCVWFKACPLCDEASDIKFDLKPDTAGVRAMIVEGGGIRGVVPLTFLRELEQAIALPLAIQDHFDIAVGSSAGALIVLDLYASKKSVEDSMKRFKTSSAQAFRKRALFRLPFMKGFPSRLLEALLSIVTDSRYTSSGINKALKSAFGEDYSMFESINGGTKVAVVATTTEDSATCIFTNYNGPDSRLADCGYKIIRPKDNEEELRVWEAARASSAAPPYFKSFKGYQDGGLGGHNNPINLALWEQDTIWSRQKKQPDIVVSLGTGFKRTPTLEDEPKEELSFFRTRCIPRLFRSFLNFFVGETRWKEIQNSLQPHFRDRYHRMNIEFFGDEPELDDLHAMASLEQQAKFHALANGDVQKCADNLIASLFYLELLELPTFDRTLFTCRGHIKCRWGPSNQALRPLIARLGKENAYFNINFQQNVPCLSAESAKAVEYGLAFSCPVIFNVMSLDDFVDITI